MGFQLFLLLCVCTSAVIATDKVVVCYYGTWATYRWSVGKFDVDHIDPNLCTHLVYSFIGINNQGTAVSLDPDLDYGDNWRRDNFRKFTALKRQNPNLKTLLAVGGWNEGSAKYSVMAASATYRQKFIQSVLEMILDHNFDGVDVDWEYPNRRDTVYGSADINNFSQLLKELREEFDKHRLMVTVAVSSVEVSASLSYDIPTITKYLDYISIMTYDMYGSWDAVTGHNAPLHRGEGDNVANEADLFNVENAVKYWLRAGCPPEKLVLGVPFYGRSFTLSNANINAPRSPASGAGLAGPYTATNGFIGYNEFCYLLKTESWTVRNDQLAKVPYAFQNRNWVSYDDVDSITTKVDYALSHNLRGIMIWSIETDDFHGLCDKGKFPLLNAINKALGGESSATTSAPGTAKPTTSAPVTAPPTTSAPIAPPVTSAPTTSDPSSEATNAAPSISTSSSSTSTSTTTTKPTPTSSVCKEIGFAANPDDCSSYFMCVAQPDASLLPVKFLCPTSLYWDQDSLNCNYHFLVECRV